MTITLSEKWDTAAEILNTFPLDSEKTRYAVALRPFLKLPRDARILEAGCGSGRILRTLDRLGFQRVTAVEISLDRLKQVTLLGNTKAGLVCSNTLPFQQHAFDGIVSAGVIEHLPQWVPWLDSLSALARPGGIVSITTDAYMWEWLNQLGLYQSIQPIDKAIWPWTLIKQAKKSGLKLLGCGGFINAPNQRCYFAGKLLSLVPGSRFAQGLFGKKPSALPDAGEETDIILNELKKIPAITRNRRRSCIWSYEAFYWFQKC